MITPTQFLTQISTKGILLKFQGMKEETLAGFQGIQKWEENIFNEDFFKNLFGNIGHRPTSIFEMNKHYLNFKIFYFRFCVWSCIILVRISLTLNTSHTRRAISEFDQWTTPEMASLDLASKKWLNPELVRSRRHFKKWTPIACMFFCINLLVNS